MITVLLVGPSKKYLTSLSEALTQEGVLEVIGVSDGSEQTLRQVKELRPQVVCLELAVSSLSGLRFAEQLIEISPTPILGILPEQTVITPEVTLQTRASGVLDICTKPATLVGMQVDAVRAKIRVLAGVKVFSRRGRPGPTKEPGPSTASPPARPGAVEPRVVAIGASTGGPQALASLLGSLDADFPWPIVCVQHMTTGFMDNMVQWMRSQTPLNVESARHGQQLEAGKVYFAPDDQHMKVRPDLTVALDRSVEVDGHCPSVTVLFESVAASVGKQAVGMLLTGMGGDGARGLLAMSRAGAATLVQDQATSVVFGMGQRALEMGAAVHVLSLEQLGKQLRAYAERRAL